MTTRRGFGPLCAVAALFGCEEVVPPREQLVVFVDTNAPVSGLIAVRPDLSADAAVDSLRVDVLSPEQLPVDVEQFLAPDARDWPISFGAVFEGEGPLLLRLRAFRADLGVATTELGEGVTQPLAEAAIDRVVRLVPPADGVERLHVILDADCTGVAPRFGASIETCVDGAQLHGAPESGLQSIAGDEVPESVAGTWGAAIEQGCQAPPPEGRVCIPGGYTLLGDRSASMLTEATFLTSTPRQPVRLSAFQIDEEEVTVGRFRADAGRLVGALPTSADVVTYCTWRGLGESANDALPLNCISAATAAEFCGLFGGTLPSEAQWEHAARGRGQGRRFPWGAAPPSCCLTSMLRFPPLASMCGIGIEPPGSHLPDPSCAMLGDVSRDGVLDLGGGMSELTRDAARGFEDDCWRFDGIPLDPVCDAESGLERTTRGGNWGSGFHIVMSAARSHGLGDIARGLRCVYPDAP